jgi:hypothetical protein
MVNNDVPLMLIKGVLDHSSIAMTEIYARLRNETLKREWEKYNQRVTTSRVRSSQSIRPGQSARQRG